MSGFAALQQMEKDAEEMSKMMTKDREDKTPEEKNQEEDKQKEEKQENTEDEKSDLEKLQDYLEQSDYKVPPPPEELNADGEPSHEHLYFHGGALKKGRSGKKFPKRIDLHNLDISFGGCGFLGMYHIGVAAAIKHFVPDCKFNRICGTSAGAIAAATILAEVPFCEMASHLINGALEARQNLLGPWTPGYLITKVLSDSLYRLLPSDIHIKASGRLFISVTKVNGSKKQMENSVISQFVSKEDLIKVISASAFIPFFSGTYPIRHRKQGCIDGGISSNLLNIFKNTVTVSPFAGSAHISPVDHGKVREWEVVRYNFADQGSDVTVANIQRLQNVLYPPAPEALGELLEAGFRDGHRFLRRYGIAKCSQCLTVRSNVRRVGKPDESTKKLHKCRDGVACDQYSEKHIQLPSNLRTVINKFVNHGKHLQQEYDDSLVIQTTKMLWTLTKYNPLYMLAKFSISTYLNVNKYFFTTLIKWLPYINEIKRDDLVSHQKVETLLGGILSTWFSDDVETVPSGKAFMRKSRAIARHVDISLTQVGVYVEENPAAPLHDPLVMSEDEDGSILEEEEEVLRLSYDETVEDAENVPSGLHSQEEALQMQNENLLAASLSTCPSASVSRVSSRVGSRTASRKPSQPTSLANSRSESRRNSVTSLQSLNAESSHDTIDNIRRITENHEVAMGYYFETNEGELVTLNLYDVTDTDAADIIGDDVLCDDEEDSNTLDSRQMHDLLQNVPKERFVTLQDDDESNDGEDVFQDLPELQDEN